MERQPTLWKSPRACFCSLHLMPPPVGSVLLGDVLRPPGETQHNRLQLSGRFKLSPCGRGGSWEALFLVFFYEKRSSVVGTKTNSEPPGGRTLRTSTSTYTPSSLMVQVEANWLRRQMKYALFCSSFGSRSEETSARVCLIHLRFLPDTCRLHGVADCRALQPLEYNLW